MLELSVRDKYPSKLVQYLVGCESFLFRASTLLEEGNSYFSHLLLSWEKGSPTCHPQVPGVTRQLEAAPKITDREIPEGNCQSLWGSPYVSKTY